eukprot:1160065-Pelagomonas_calceolata.AAC.4
MSARTQNTASMCGCLLKQANMPTAGHSIRHSSRAHAIAHNLGGVPVQPPPWHASPFGTRACPLHHESPRQPPWARGPAQKRAHIICDICTQTGKM